MSSSQLAIPCDDGDIYVEHWLRFVDNMSWRLLEVQHGLDVTSGILASRGDHAALAPYLEDIDDTLFLTQKNVGFLSEDLHSGLTSDSFDDIQWGIRRIDYLLGILRAAVDSGNHAAGGNVSNAVPENSSSLSFAPLDDDNVSNVVPEDTSSLSFASSDRKQDFDGDNVCNVVPKGSSSLLTLPFVRDQNFDGGSWLRFTPRFVVLYLGFYHFPRQQRPRRKRKRKRPPPSIFSCLISSLLSLYLAYSCF